MIDFFFEVSVLTKEASLSYLLIFQNFNSHEMLVKELLKYMEKYLALSEVEFIFRVRFKLSPSQVQVLSTTQVKVFCCSLFVFFFFFNCCIKIVWYQRCKNRILNMIDLEAYKKFHSYYDMNCGWLLSTQSFVENAVCGVDFKVQRIWKV